MAIKLAGVILALPIELVEGTLTLSMEVLAGVTLALLLEKPYAGGRADRGYPRSMEVLVGVILAQLLKATSGEKTARPGSHGVVASRKLHCLARPAHFGVSAPAKRLRDAEVEAGGQRPTNAEAEDQRSEDQRDQVRSPTQEVLGHGAKT